MYHWVHGLLIFGPEPGDIVRPGSPLNQGSVDLRPVVLKPIIG